MNGALTLETLPHFLFSRGLVAPASVVDDIGFVVRDRSRRNRNFSVRAPGGDDLLVKQAGSVVDGESTRTLALEAELLRAVATDEALASLRWFAPSFVLFDPDDVVLVTELVHPATSLTKLHLGGGTIEFPVEAGTTCGRMLGAFHAVLRGAARDGRLPHIDRRPAFAFDIPRYAGDQAGEASGALRDFARLLESSGVYTALDRVRALYDAGSDVVHGDVRWDNILLTSGATPRAEMNLRLIDWELVALGDAAWDVACFLAEYLRFSAMTSAVLTHDAATPVTAYSPAVAHDSARAFLSAYARRRGLRGPGRRSLLERVLAYLPFTLVIAAYEGMQRQSTVPVASRLGIGFAAAATADPASRAAEWFGITDEWFGEAA